MNIRPALLIGNWKMNLDAAQSAALADHVVALSEGLERTSVWIAPSFTAIPACAERVRGTEVKLGAQNVHWDATGAFTGEVSPPMIKEFGCEFAIVGHSERRHVFGENESQAARRALGALNNGLVAILCVGEKIADREGKRTFDVIRAQIGPLFESLEPAHDGRIVIAYEPVWAIGTGKVATPDEIGETHAFIRECWQLGTSRPIPPVIYGGSVAPDNFAQILRAQHVAGALVGGASLSPQKFGSLIHIAEATG